MTEQDQERIPRALWIFMGVGVGVLLIFLAAAVLNSLPLSVLFAFLLAMFCLGVWQREKVTDYTLRFCRHPKTEATIKTVGHVLAAIFGWILKALVFFSRGLMSAIAAVVSLFRAYRLRSQSHFENPSTVDTEHPSLREWKRAKSRDVKRPSDKRTKYCLKNIGKEIEIKYRGHTRRIRPTRVYTKAKYHRTYVDAEVDGETRTFNIDDISI